MRRVTHALKGLSPKPEADDAHLLHTLGQGLALRRLAEPSDFAQDRRSRRSMPRGWPQELTAAFWEDTPACPMRRTEGKSQWHVQACRF